MLTDEQARDAVIVALDCTRERALELTDLLAGHARWVKVGMTLFYRYGPSMVDEMHARGFKVFLDLKVHDIPFQVKGAVHSASLSGADILSIHGLGTAQMISAGREGAEEAAADRGVDESGRTKLVAISVLTSMDEDALHSIGVDGSIKDEVARLASLSYYAGADGIVCSPPGSTGDERAFGTKCAHRDPRVRPEGAEKGDQVRISTPSAAIKAGASKLVVGRPITCANNPVEAFESIISELKN